jgi:serine/threonine-protein kinase
LSEVGEVLAGKYRLTREIGEGGMGRVFEAVHEQIGKKVAIKLLRPELTEKEEAATRFQREAWAAGAIGHPGIIDIHDMGTTADGEMFLVMELLVGTPLNDVMDRTVTMEANRAVFVTCQVLSALDAAHAKGIVHRDMKPENIFVVDSGRGLPEVKLLDFGISKVMQPLEGTDSHLTLTGTVLGTPLYMSPEQARGKSNLDQRVDIYAVGVILYQCLTGRVPFTGANYNELLANILTESAVEPSHYLPGLDPRIEEIVLRALEKDPADRFPTARDMMLALLPFLDEHQTAMIPLSNEVRASARSSAGSSRTPVPAGPRESVATPPGKASSVDVLSPTLEVAPSSTTVPGAPRPRSRGVVLVLGAASVLLIAGVGWVVWPSVWNGRPEPTANVVPDRAAIDQGPPGPRNVETPARAAGDAAPAKAPDATAPAKAPDAGQTAPDTVEVRIAVEPPEARISIDDYVMDGNPFTGRFPRSNVAHKVRAEVRGYRTWAGILVFDQDRSLDLTLERVRSHTNETKNQVEPRDDPWRDGPGKRPPPPRDDPWRDGM